MLTACFRKSVVARPGPKPLFPRGPVKDLNRVDIMAWSQTNETAEVRWLVDINYPRLDDHDFGQMELSFAGCSCGLEMRCLACVIRGYITREVPVGHSLVLHECWVNGKKDDGKLRELLKFGIVTT